MISTFRFLLAVSLCSTALLQSVDAAEDLRLSRTLIPTECADSGLKQLTSDQIAILDALVRRDIAAGSRVSQTAEIPSDRFSERLSADERKNAGLTLLTEEQLVRLDSYVARLSAPVTSAGSFSTAGTSGSSVLSARTLRRAPEIHGSITLMYGQGSDGYSERGGAMVLTYEDPSGIALAVGYSEVRSKGGHYLRNYHDRFYDRYHGGFGRSLFDRDPFSR